MFTKTQTLYKSPKVLLGFQTMALNLTLHKYVVTLHFKRISNHISTIVNFSKPFLVYTRQNTTWEYPSL